MADHFITQNWYITGQVGKLFVVLEQWGLLEFVDALDQVGLGPCVQAPVVGGQNPRGLDMHGSRPVFLFHVQIVLSLEYYLKKEQRIITIL